MKKARKSKFVIGGVALLSCVALAGVGYSSWVITSTVTSQTGNVSVTASAVEDDRITIGNVSFTTGKDSYKFGPSTDGSGTLISASSDTSEESLSVSFSFDVTYASTLGKSYDITLALASNVKCSSTNGTVDSTSDMDALAYATGTSVSGSAEGVSGTYLAAPADDLIGTGITIATVDKDNGVKAADDYSSGVSNGTGSLKVEVGTASSASGTYTATVTVTADFGWGTYFNSQNPVELSEATSLDAYVAGLNWLNEAFNGANFTYTIGGSVQATETSEQTESTNTVSD